MENRIEILEQQVDELEKSSSSEQSVKGNFIRLGAVQDIEKKEEPEEENFESDSVNSESDAEEEIEGEGR